MPRRSLRIDGKSTSIHLEEAFWTQIEQLSDEQGISWSEYCRRIVETVKSDSNRSAAIKERLLEIARTSAPAAPASTWKIERDDEWSERRFNQAIITIGRSRQCDISIRSRKVSRIHAVLFFVDNRWWVVDMQSHNGTYVGGRIVTRRKIRSADTVRIADVRIRHSTSDAGVRS